MDKEFELKKYRDLVAATLDYYIVHLAFNNEMKDEYFCLKTQAEEHYSKGKLTILKSWFKDLTSDFIEDRYFGFNEYLIKTTNYEIDIFESYFKRIEKIIEKDQIKTDSQFYELKNYVDYLIQNNNSDKVLIQRINEILLRFESKN
ncbi:hypothetical protein [Empedobacter sp. UBA7248]|uniref:hypothetical protein n=1 Tax=Empedobacter sp. UBA7248 TaxID=1946448 RepID=UPI0025B956CF|nr:hypothetical protein [Empedobacter sp. UBA7248]